MIEPPLGPSLLWFFSWRRGKLWDLFCAFSGGRVVLFSSYQQVGFEVGKFLASGVAHAASLKKSWNHQTVSKAPSLSIWKSSRSGRNWPRRCYSPGTQQMDANGKWMRMDGLRNESLRQTCIVLHLYWGDTLMYHHVLEVTNRQTHETEQTCLTHPISINNTGLAITE